MKHFVFILILLYIILIHHIEGRKPRPASSWHSMDVHEVDREWEEGDDEHELSHEFDIRKKNDEKRNKVLR